MHTFRQEDVTNAVEQVRYYIEKTDENKYYLMVASDGRVATLHTDDLEDGSLNDFYCRFKIVQG